MRNATTVLLLIIFALCIVDGARYLGSLRTPKNKWHFIAKFSYPMSKVHQLLNFTVRTNNRNLRALLYLQDKERENLFGHDWDKVYALWQSGTYDCNNLTAGALQQRPVVSGEPGFFTPASFVTTYYWYLAVADCTQEDLDIESYDFHFTNPEYGYWEREFSFDRWGVAQTYIAFFILYIILVALHLYGCWQLYRIEAYHPLVKVLTIAIMLEFFNILFQLIHYSGYAENGIGAPALEAFGNLLNMGSNLLLMFFCILVAKGWAITSHYLSQKNIVFIVMSLFILGYLFLFIWDNFARDPALTLYFYESVPGFLVLLLRTILVFWFLWCLRDTLRLENLPERRQFYKIFGMAYSAWFIMLPLAVALCSLFDPWVRFKIVRGISIAIDFAGFGALVFLLWPTRAQNYFTIRTTSQLLEEDNKNVKYDL